MPSPAPELTGAQCRAFDRYAIEVLGIPGIVLMENAGRNAADTIHGLLPAGGSCRPHVCVLCGKGNNGGDGFVIARHLAMKGCNVEVDLLGDPDALSPDAGVNYRIAASMSLPVHVTRAPEDVAVAADRWRGAILIVDALLGTGFTGQVSGLLREAIERVNGLGHGLVVSVDVPSGLNADTGEPGGTAIRAHHTITFIALKVGYRRPHARQYTGVLHVADIGAPADMILARLEARI